jgi:hypothetical protein
MWFIIIELFLRSQIPLLFVVIDINIIDMEKLKFQLYFKFNGKCLKFCETNPKRLYEDCIKDN